MLPMARATRIVALLALASLSAPVAARDAGSAAGRFRVLYAEPVVLEGLTPQADREAARTVPFRVNFDAYGRRFDLLLETNKRLLAGLDEPARADAGRLQLLRGTLQGVPDSWVRLTVDGDRQSGMVWDGRDLYVIEPAEDVVPRAVAPLAARGRSPVVYRLSDTLTDPGVAVCEAVRIDQSEARTSALGAYKALVSELRQAVTATSVSGRLQVSAIADYEYFQLATSTQIARNRIIAIFNNVDGIYSAQVGIQIELSGTPTVFQDPSDPFTKSEARDLLVELADYRAARSTLRSTGLTHLLTGRDLNGSTAGIAYIGSLCLSRYGASLSQATSTLASLVVAHEIGHNFGAPHDGEASQAGEPVNPCESTPRTFLMAPQVNGSDQFSQCSLAQIQPEVASANCILPPRAGADLALATSATAVGATAGQAFSLGAVVSNRGEVAVESLQLFVTLPNGLTAIGATATAGGLCATQAGGLGCTWTDLGAGVTSNVTLNLRADETGSFAVPAALAATEDTSSGNDDLTYQVTVTSSTPAPPAPTTSKGGGGGALGLWQVLALLAVAVVRMRRASSATSPAASVVA
jgi:hypothetical protein